MQRASASVPAAASTCPLCGGANACVPALTGRLGEPCWCESASFTPALLARVPVEQRGRACVCARCAAGAALRPAEPPRELQTGRLLLRPFEEADREPFAAMNADPEVMRYFASTQSRAASDRSIDAWEADRRERGWSNWAVVVRDGGAFAGFVGLSVPRRALPFMPCVEIGWRLARPFWHRGYASEGAEASLAFGFEQLGLDEIVSFTSVLNRPSRAVMERIGLRDADADFDHPALPEGSPLRRHCLYRLTRADWERQRDDSR